MKKHNLSKNTFIDIVNLLNKRYDTSQDIKLRDNTPDILVKCGIKNYPMLMNSKHILDNILTQEEAKEIGIYKKRTNYHGLGVKQFLEIINEIDNPVAIYRWNYTKNKKYGFKDYVVLTNVNNNIIPIYIETTGNYNNVEINTNKIKTIYGGNNVIFKLEQNVRNGYMKKIYSKTKKTKLTTTINTAATTNSFNDINIS